MPAGTRLVTRNQTNPIGGGQPIPSGSVAVILVSPADAQHAYKIRTTVAVREKRRLRETKQIFIRSFPFDIINLDLETYLFKPTGGIPGKVVNAFRKVFDWQRQLGTLPNKSQYQVNEFTLMFTTRVGPSNLGTDYFEMMRKSVDQNLADHPSLKPTYSERSANRDSAAFLQEDFDEFFKLAVPKTIVSLLWEQAWEIDSKNGIQVFQFEPDIEFHHTEYERLRAELQRAHDQTQLPENLDNQTHTALNNLLIRIRTKTNA